MAKMKPKKLIPKLKVEKVRVGAPNKPEMEVKHPNGLTKEMEKRAHVEAGNFKLTRAALNRMVYEWFYTALDTARGDVDAHKLFDEQVEIQTKKTKEI